MTTPATYSDGNGRAPITLGDVRRGWTLSAALTGTILAIGAIYVDLRVAHADLRGQCVALAARVEERDRRYERDLDLLRAAILATKEAR